MRFAHPGDLHVLVRFAVVGILTIALVAETLFLYRSVNGNFPMVRRIALILSCRVAILSQCTPLLDCLPCYRDTRTVRPVSKKTGR